MLCCLLVATPGNRLQFLLAHSVVRSSPSSASQRLPIREAIERNSLWRGLASDSEPPVTQIRQFLVHVP